jgi:hypothetical protein
MKSHQSHFLLRPAIVALSFAAAYFLDSYACAESVVLLLPRRIGESIDLEMTSTRERQIPGQQPTRGSSTTPVRVEVLDVADDQTIIGWSTGKPKISGDRFNKQVAKAVDPLLDLAADQTIELVFDDEFTPRSIRNIDELVRFSHKALDLMQKSLPNDEATAAVIPRVRELFNNPESAQNIFMQKPGRYFLVYGWELEPGKPRVEEVSLPSPFGPDPLPGTVTIELKPHQPDAAHYNVLYKQEFDKEAVRQLIQSVAQRFAGDRLDPDRPLPTLDVTDEGEFKVNRHTGWIEHARVVRTSRHDQGVQIDTSDFRVVSNKPNRAKPREADE